MNRKNTSRKIIRIPLVLPIAIGIISVIIYAGVFGTQLITNSAKYTVTNALVTADGNFNYTESTDGTISISKYVGTDTEVVIPSTIDGKNVTKIGNCAFYGCSNVTSIEIPEGVTSIVERAFDGCSSLISIEIPEGVTTIEYSIFKNCKSLNNVKIPSSVTDIKYSSAFYGCSSLANIEIDVNNQNYASEDGVMLDKNKTKIYYYPAGKKELTYTIPKTIVTIGESAFQDCTNLTSVEITEGVANIENSAFKNCTNLTSVKISKEVISIDYGIFRGCTSLVNIEVDSNNQNYASEDGVMFNKNKTQIYCYPAGKKESTYIIPTGVTKMEMYAFSSCSNLTSVEIPEGVAAVSYGAFENCTNLTDIKIPEGVTYIGTDTFMNCTSLTNIELPSSVSSTGYSSFSGCSNLTNIEIPEKMKNIQMSIFAGCRSLTSIEIPEGVTTIGSWAFSGCSNLKSIAIPEEVTWIGVDAFSNCSNLTIFCKSNSYTEEYAIDEGISYTIDDEAPTIESVTGNPTEYTTENVTLTINAKDELSGLALKAYSFDGGTTWQKENTKTYEENTDGIVIKVRDALGNLYTHEEINITKIQQLAIESEKYNIEGINITKIQPNTTIEDFKANLQIVATEISIYNGDNEIIADSDIINTGMQLKIATKDETETYILVVAGDTNADGVADFKDMIQINKHRLKKTLLEGEYLLAADVTEDEVADFKDLVKINKLRLSKITEL